MCLFNPNLFESASISVDGNSKRGEVLGGIKCHLLRFVKDHRQQLLVQVGCSLMRCRVLLQGQAKGFFIRFCRTGLLNTGEGFLLFVSVVKMFSLV